VIAATVFATLTGVALTVVPRTLQAGDDRPAERAASDPQHQALLEVLVQLIGQCREVLATHQTVQRPALEVLLWLEDADPPGVVDPVEIGLLSHSRILQTLTFTRLVPGADVTAQDLLALRPPGVTAGSRSTAGTDPYDLLDPSFCRRWQAFPLTEVLTIGTGLSDLTIRPVPAGAGGAAALEIALTWSAESVDGPDMASAVIDVPERLWTAQE
jgi:hypothetical protein